MITSDQAPFLIQALFTWRVTINSRNLAENLIAKFKDICKTSSNIGLWWILFSSLSCFPKQKHLGEVSVRGHHSAHLSTSLFAIASLRNKTKGDRTPQQKSELNRKLLSKCTKLDERNLMVRIRPSGGNDNVADFTVDNYAALMLKHPQKRLALFRTPQISIDFQHQSFSSTWLSFPSPTALVHGWMAFGPKFWYT